MAEQIVIRSSSASLSWIDEETSLPEHDYSGPGTPISQNFVFRKKGFRFANFLEAEITVSDGRPIRHRFSPKSAYYGRHSAFGVPTLTFAMIQKTSVEKGRVVFRQTVGARTHTPETVARKLGVGIEKLSEALKIP